MLQVPITHPDEYFKFRKASPKLTKNLVTIFDVMPTKDVINKVNELVRNVSGRWKWTRMTDKEDLVQTVLMNLTVRAYFEDRVSPEAFLNVVTCSEILKIHTQLGQKAPFKDYQSLRPAGDFFGGFYELVGTLEVGQVDYISKEERRANSHPIRKIKVTKAGELVGVYRTAKAAAEAIGNTSETGSVIHDYLKGRSKNPDGYRFEYVFTPRPVSKKKHHRKFEVYHPNGKRLGTSDNVYTLADELRINRSSIYEALKKNRPTKGGYRFVWVSK